MLFGATVIRGVKYIWPYSSLVKNIGYLVVCGNQKARNNDNMLSFAQQNLKYPLQTREKSSWKTLGGFATSGFSLGFFSRLSCIFVDTASRISAYCPTIWGYLSSSLQFLPRPPSLLSALGLALVLQRFWLPESQDATLLGFFNRVAGSESFFHRSQLPIFTQSITYYWKFSNASHYFTYILWKLNCNSQSYQE